MRGIDTIVVANINEEGRFGGPERRITLVAEGLKKYEIGTIVLIPEMDSSRFELALTARGLRYAKLNFSRLTLELPKLVRYVARFPFDLAETVYFLRKHKVDLVHVNGSYQFRSAIAAFIARKKLVWHVNDAKMHWLVKAVFGLLAPRIADAFIFSSEAARRYYFPHGFDARRISSAHIAPPVEVARFLPRVSWLDARMAISAPTRIVTVTGINPDKGVEYFIEAASLIYQACGNVRFFVAAAVHESHRKYFSELNALVRRKGLADVLQFVGFVDDIPKFLAEGDIFLYTSNTEAGPTAVWEAMAAGLPVVTTNVGGIPEYLVGGADALIAAPKDAKTLAALTLRLIDDAGQRTALGQRARKKVVDRLSVDVAARKHAELYRYVVNKKEEYADL